MRYFGIDISSSSIKIAEVDRSGILRGVWVEDFDESILAQSGYQRREAVKSFLLAFLAKHNIHSAHLFFAVLNNSVFTRLIKLPKVEKHKIPQMARFEAEQQVPFQIQDVVWDYCILSDEPAADYLEVGIAAAKKTIVDDYLYYGEIAGMRTTLVGTHAYSLHAVIGAAEEQYLIVDIGKHTTELVLADSKKIWSRTILHGSDDINQQITGTLAQQGKELNPAEIESLKHAAAIDTPADGHSHDQQVIREAVLKATDTLISEVKQSFHFYRSQHNKNCEPIRKIYLTGGGCRVKGIDRYIGSKMDAETVLIDLNPFYDSTAMDALKMEEGLRLAVPFGLALTGINKTLPSLNLLPKKIRIKNIVEFYLPFFSLACVAVSILFLIAKFVLSSSFADKSAYYDHLKSVKDQIVALQTKRKVVLGQNEGLTRIIDPIYEAFKYKKRLPEILDAIAGSMPSDVWLTRFGFSQSGDIELEGKVRGSFAVINKFVENLKTVELFETIKIEKAMIDDEGKTALKKFLIAIRMRA